MAMLNNQMAHDFTWFHRNIQFWDVRIRNWSLWLVGWVDSHNRLLPVLSWIALNCCQPARDMTVWEVCLWSCIARGPIVLRQLWGFEFYLIPNGSLNPNGFTLQPGFTLCHLPATAWLNTVECCESSSELKLGCKIMIAIWWEEMHDQPISNIKFGSYPTFAQRQGLALWDVLPCDGMCDAMVSGEVVSFESEGWRVCCQRVRLGRCLMFLM
jgi:hypothetical protein